MPDGMMIGGGASGGELSSLDDEQLVDGFLSAVVADRVRAEQFFEVIVRRYHWLISHVVRSSQFKYPAWASAEDVISRVIYKVYRGLALWRRDGKLSSFIARIATTEMIDTFRRVKRDKTWNPHLGPADPESDRPTAVDVAPARERSPEADLVHRERNRLIEQLLGDVCRDWKDSVIVNEYMIGERSGKEISDKYGMSEDLVYQRARRLKVRLMKWLAEHGITSAEQLLGEGRSRVQ